MHSVLQTLVFKFYHVYGFFQLQNIHELIMLIVKKMPCPTGWAMFKVKIGGVQGA